MAERRIPKDDDYPNRSLDDETVDRPKGAPQKREKAQKVTKGAVIKKKKSFFRRFAETFGVREGQGVIDYILHDIIIPATQNMIVDSIIDGAEMAILGEVRGRGRRGRSGYSGRPMYSYDRVSYRDDYRSSRDRRDDRDRDRDRRDDREPKGLRDYEDIRFDNKRDAQAVLDGLVDILERYGQVTVADVYDLSGVTPEYTVGYFGWRNLAGSAIVRGRDGYYLELPRPALL